MTTARVVYSYTVQLYSCTRRCGLWSLLLVAGRVLPARLVLEYHRHGAAYYCHNSCSILVDLLVAGSYCSRRRHRALLEYRYSIRTGTAYVPVQHTYRYT